MSHCGDPHSHNQKPIPSTLRLNVYTSTFVYIIRAIVYCHTAGCILSQQCIIEHPVGSFIATFFIWLLRFISKFLQEPILTKVCNHLNIMPLVQLCTMFLCEMKIMALRGLCVIWISVNKELPMWFNYQDDQFRLKQLSFNFDLSWDLNPNKPALQYLTSEKTDCTQ